LKLLTRNKPKPLFFVKIKNRQKWALIYFRYFLQCSLLLRFILAVRVVNANRFKPIDDTLVI